MKTKNLFLVAVLLFAASFAKAQSYESIIEFNKSKQSAATIEVPFNKDITTGTIKDLMKKNAYTPKESNGFIMVPRVKPTPTSKETTYIYRVKKKKGLDACVVYLFTQVDDAKTTQLGDTIEMNILKHQLNALPATIAAFDLERQISDQQDKVTKAEKKLNNLLDEQSSLENKRKKLADKIIDLKKNIAQLKSNLDNNPQSDKADKMRKKLNNLLDDQSSLEKKRNDADQDIINNKQDQVNQKVVIDEQRKIFDQLKAKRK